MKLRVGLEGLLAPKKSKRNRKPGKLFLPTDLDGRVFERITLKGNRKTTKISCRIHQTRLGTTVSCPQTFSWCSIYEVPVCIVECYWTSEE